MRATRQRANDREIHGQTWGPVPRARLEPRRADQFERGLMTVHTAEMCRNADRPTEIGAERQAAKAGGQRRGAASGGSTRCSRDVPRIVRSSVDRVVALPVTEHDRHVGLADDDGACRFETLDGNRRAGALHVLERRQAPGVRRALIGECLLDRDRHAVEGPPRLALSQRFVRLPCARDCLLAKLPDDRVDLRVVEVDPPKREVQQFGR